VENKPNTHLGLWRHHPSCQHTFLSPPLPIHWAPN